MNRYHWIYISAITLLALLSCREDQPRPRDSGSLDSAQNEIDPFTDTLFLDSLLEKLNKLQNAIAVNPRRPEIMQHIVAVSFDTIAVCIYTVGQVIAVQDSNGDTAGIEAKRAAATAANQWALTIKSWIEGTNIPYGSTIQGKVLYSRELLKRQKNDTLLTLFMVPAGSVVLR
jgi:hypothetical protein